MTVNIPTTLKEIRTVCPFCAAIVVCCLKSKNKMGDQLKLGLQLFPGWKAVSEFLTREILQSEVPVYLECSYDGKNPISF